LAGIDPIHPHQLRHTSYSAYEKAGGTPGSAMRLFGWVSPEMPLHYGKAAADERAQAESRRLSPADRF
jgi:integrase